jgi:KipI family sensor histidine kinase inhibitor
VDIRRVGADALLLDVDDVTVWTAELERRRAAGTLIVDEIVPGARTVLLDGLADAADLAGSIRTWPEPAATMSSPGRLVEIPTYYDGEDLEEVAAQWGIGVDEVVAIHTGTEFRVAFFGFAPGFAYLGGLPRPVARRSSPRTRVPVGSVAVADSYTAVYPSASPGGWQLIGRTDAVLFDVDRDPPALLGPGDRVRFTRA